MKHYERIRALREDRDLKQSEVATILGNGDRKNKTYIFILFCRNVEISTNLQGLLRRSPSNPPGYAGQSQERGEKSGIRSNEQNKFFCLQ